jgi:hypothetical protein
MSPSSYFTPPYGVVELTRIVRGTSGFALIFFHRVRFCDSRRSEIKDHDVHQTELKSLGANARSSLPIASEDPNWVLSIEAEFQVVNAKYRDPINSQGW